MAEQPAPRLDFASSFLIGAVVVVGGMFLIVYLPAILHIDSPLRDAGTLPGLVSQINLFWDESLGGIAMLLGGGLSSRLLSGRRSPRRSELHSGSTPQTVHTKGDSEDRKRPLDVIDARADTRSSTEDQSPAPQAEEPHA